MPHPLRMARELAQQAILPKEEDAVLFTNLTTIKQKKQIRKTIPEKSNEQRIRNHFTTMLAELDEEEGEIDLLTSEDIDLNKEIIEYLRMEKSNFFDPEDSVKKDTGFETLQKLINGLERKTDGRVYAKYPKLPVTKPLSKNIARCKATLKRTLEKIDKNPEEYTKIRDYVQPWIDKGVMVPVTMEELKNIPVWSELPWHSVISAGKFRVVINGSATEAGCVSTTEFLDPGPNLLPKITRMLTKLRQLPHFLVSDIEKAFLQVRIARPDNYLLIMTWIVPDGKGGWKKQLYRFERMMWGTTVAPFVSQRRSEIFIPSIFEGRTSRLYSRI